MYLMDDVYSLSFSFFLLSFFSKHIMKLKAVDSDVKDMWEVRHDTFITFDLVVATRSIE